MRRVTRSSPDARIVEGGALHVVRGAFQIDDAREFHLLRRGGGGEEEEGGHPPGHVLKDSGCAISRGKIWGHACERGGNEQRAKLARSVPRFLRTERRYTEYKLHSEGGP